MECPSCKSPIAKVGYGSNPHGGPVSMVFHCTPCNKYFRSKPEVKENPSSENKISLKDKIKHSEALRKTKASVKEYGAPIGKSMVKGAAVAGLEKALSMVKGESAPTSQGYRAAWNDQTKHTYNAGSGIPGCPSHAMYDETSKAWIAPGSPGYAEPDPSWWSTVSGGGGGFDPSKIAKGLSGMGALAPGGLGMLQIAGEVAASPGGQQLLGSVGKGVGEGVTPLMAETGKGVGELVGKEGAGRVVGTGVTEVIGKEGVGGGLRELIGKEGLAGLIGGEGGLKAITSGVGHTIGGVGDVMRTPGQLASQQIASTTQLGSQAMGTAGQLGSQGIQAYRPIAQYPMYPQAPMYPGMPQQMASTNPKESLKPTKGEVALGLLAPPVGAGKYAYRHKGRIVKAFKGAKVAAKKTAKKWAPTKGEVALTVGLGPVGQAKYAWRQRQKLLSAGKSLVAHKKRKVGAKIQLAKDIGSSVKKYVVGSHKSASQARKEIAYGNPNQQVEKVVTAPYKQLKIGD